MKHIIYLLITFMLMACGSGNSKRSSDPHLKNIKSLPPSPENCITSVEGINTQALTSSKCSWFSEYQLFSGNPADTSKANNGVLPYYLNSSLFTDFSGKSRYIVFPDNAHAQYHETNAFTFPSGTAIIKIFSLPNQYDLSQDIIEIRLMIKKETGWVFYPYTWHPESQDAYYNRSGMNLEKSINIQGLDTLFTYSIPSSGECGTCHQKSQRNIPIGPKARNLNTIIQYNGQDINQLALWKNMGWISGLPPDLTSIDTMPNWQDNSKPITNRAKAYLDINCAHCHSDGGAGDLSGLSLEYWRKNIDGSHGLCNPAHGWRGGGYDIWPGEGDISSITVRMRHTEPKDRMPPIGRSLVDEEAAQLISDWIDTLPYQTCSGV